jgi:hypothetical protein
LAALELGPLLTKSQGRPVRWRDLFLVFLPGTLGVLAPLGYGFYRAIYAYARFGPSAAVAWSRSWYLLASFSSLVLLGLALHRLYHAHRFIAIHKYGIHIHLSPFRNHKLRWSQITGIAADARQDRFLGIPLRTVHQAVIYPTLGNPIRLDNRLGEISSIIENIEANIYPRIAPQIRQDFQSGKRVYFGALVVHLNGFEMNRRIIPWDQISHLSVDGGFLVVKSDQFKPVRIPVSKIPNLDLLFQLIERQPFNFQPATRAH